MIRDAGSGEEWRLQMTKLKKADPQARRRVILIVAGSIPVGLVLIYLLQNTQHLIEEWMGRGQKMARLNIMMAVLAVAISGPLLDCSFYLWRLGNRILTESCFPPAGMAVLRDTPVLTGPAAHRRAWAFHILAGLLIFAAIAIPLLLSRLTSLLVPHIN